MEKRIDLNFKEKDKILRISKVLGNKARLDILELLSYESLSIDEIAKKTNSPLTTVCSNIAILSDAGLIRSRLQSGKHGTMKLCSIVYESVHFNLVLPAEEEVYKEDVVNIPIGSYFNFDIKPTCGLISEKEYIGRDDDPSTFYSPRRFEAQLLWFYQGFVEYLIPFDNTKEVKELSLSMELCSEAPYYRNVWASDITILLNDVDVGTWKCPGDFGGKKGKYTPDWWAVNSTQFGLLKTWNVNDKGCDVDFKKISDVSITEVMKDGYKRNVISLKIMIKDDAKNIGGINLFGEKFGEYPQGIIAKIRYKTKE